MADKGLRRDEIPDEDPEELFEMQDVVGEGSFGLICTCKSNLDNKVYAIKFLEIEDQDEDDLQKEIDILAEARDCTYVVAFYGCYLKENTLMLVMEYCDGGSALDIINLAKHKFTETQACAVLRDMLLGLEYLHTHKVLHRDIKAANVLLTNDGVAKLADFGVSAKLAYTMQRRGTVVGSPYWMAPEVINVSDDDDESTGYDLKADVWSTGITAIELVQGEPPLFQYQQLRVIFMIPNKDPPKLSEPEKWSQDFNKFIEVCLRKDPVRRHTPALLLKSKAMQTGARQHDCLRTMMEEVAPKMEQARAEKKAAGLDSDADDFGPGTMISVKSSRTRRGTIGTFDTDAAWGTFVVNSGANTGQFNDRDDGE